MVALDMERPTALKESVLTVRGVGRGFPKGSGEVRVLADVELSLYGGEIVGLLGRSGSGKSTLLRIIAGLIRPSSGEVIYRGEPVEGPAEGIERRTISFASKLKEVCIDVLGLSHDDVYTQEGKEKTTNFPHILGGGLFWTNRQILQYIGTECFRAIDPNCWTKATLREAERLFLKGVELVVITDVRFANECAAIRAAGGEVWRITRPSIDAPIGGIVGHASEIEMDSMKDSDFDAVILNDGTIYELRTKVLKERERFETEKA